MNLSLHPQEKKHTVLIFRQNLFRASEPFIPIQTLNLDHYVPLYLGRVQWGNPPEGQKAFAIWPFPSRKPTLKELKRFLESILSLSPKVWLNLTTKQEQEKIKLIHAHFGTDAVRALSVAKSLKVPMVTNFHGFDATLDDWRYLTSPVWFPYPFLKKRLAREGDLFLCPSRFIKERVLKMGFPADKTLVHHIGIDLNQFSLRSPEMEENYIIHVARLVPGKGTSTLIRALSLLPERHKKTKLISIGAGALRKKLEQLAVKLGVSEKIKFMGACDQKTVKEYTSHAAIAILPSIQAPNKWVEGLGLALVEASASGVPTIGSRIGGIPETMIENESGLLFTPGDATELAKKITLLLDDKNLRIKMGQRGREFIEQEFCKEKQNKKLEAIYDSLL